MARRGRSVSNSSACRGRSLCPLRRPKNARTWWSAESIAVLIAVQRGDRRLPCTGRYSKCAGGGHDRSLPAHREGRLAQSALKRIGKVASLPRKSAVLIRGPAEMAISGGAAVDRSAELQGAADIGRPQREQFRQQ